MGINFFRGGCEGVKGRVWQLCLVYALFMVCLCLVYALYDPSEWVWSNTRFRRHPTGRKACGEDFFILGKTYLSQIQLFCVPL